MRAPLTVKEHDHEKETHAHASGGHDNLFDGLRGPANKETPADIIHPNIHSKVGQGDGTNANPNGANTNGGNIHGIANAPGKGGDNPNADGTRGQANELETMHGGIGLKNRNAD